VEKGGVELDNTKLLEQLQ
jgi:hypothetical protein